MAATLAALRKVDRTRLEGPIVLVISGHALKDGDAQPGALEPSILGDRENLTDIISAARARFHEHIQTAGGI